MIEVDEMWEDTMKTIRQIFHDDIKSLLKSFFALVIVVGVWFLPALYAWCNIYSNWDPYGNTQNVTLGVISLDVGYTDEEGEYHNMGSEVLEELMESESIHWVQVDSEEEALSKVESGEYYASLVIEEDFTEKMYHIFRGSIDKPVLVFYQNQKKNAVATKITDTVVENIQNSINEKFIKVIYSTVFADANELHDTIEEEDGIDGIIERMQEISDEISGYEEMIYQVIAYNQILEESLADVEGDTDAAGADASSAAGSIGSAKSSLNTTATTLSGFSGQVNSMMNECVTALNSAESALNAADLTGETSDLADQLKACNTDLATAIKDLETLESVVLSTESETLAQIVAVEESLTSVETSLGDLAEALVDPTNAAVDVAAAETAQAEAVTKAVASAEIESAISDLQNTQATMTNTLIPQMDDMMDSLSMVMDDAQSLMTQLSNTLYGMGDVLDALNLTVTSADDSLELTAEALNKMNTRLTEAISEVQEASEDEKVETLINTLSGDPEQFGEFFAEPVQIESEIIYPVENYGSAVAPFYTVLAIWVGVLILTAILKVHPDPKKYPDATNTQKFFGRYLLFFVLGQIQTLIIYLGDLFLLGIQCVHPMYFYIACAAASLAFSSLIFALVYAFGDVGKAMAVVIVVLQIAGSSGTYPIELLPEFFQRIYTFFPFPYAINAMRECIAGMYEGDFILYLLELMIFVVVALAIGIWLRAPFRSLMHFMERRMEDTEMM